MMLDRSTYIGASDIGALARLNPWETPLDVYNEKKGLVVVEDNLPMKIGRALESGIIQLYVQNAEGLIYWKENCETVLKDWQGCTPDAIIETPEGYKYGLEVKTASYYVADRWGAAGTDFIPEEYFCQCQWSMDVTGFDRWDCAVLISGSDFRIYTIPANKKIQNRLREIARKFWFEHYLPGIPPDPSTDEERRNALINKYSDRSDTIGSTATAERYASNLALINDSFKKLHKEKTIAENKIIEELAGARKIIGAAWTFSLSEKGRIYFRTKGVLI